MSKSDLLAGLLESLIKNPIGFLVTFIFFFLVPSSFLFNILIVGNVAKNTGQDTFGSFLILIYDVIDKISLVIFETFIDLVIWIAVLVFIASSILTAFGIKK